MFHFARTARNGFVILNAASRSALVILSTTSSSALVILSKTKHLCSLESGIIASIAAEFYTLEILRPDKSGLSMTASSIEHRASSIKYQVSRMQAEFF